MTKIQTLIALYSALKQLQPLVNDVVGAVKALWAALQPFINDSSSPLVGQTESAEAAALTAAGIPESDARGLLS